MGNTYFWSTSGTTFQSMPTNKTPDLLVVFFSGVSGFTKQILFQVTLF